MIESKPASVAAELEEPVRAARELAKALGLDPYPVNYWIVDYDEMNQLIAYQGFQERYPHWRWGMGYDRRRKQDRFDVSRAFELVNNDNPANAFLQESNSLADQKAVITHVEAHADFFKHNQWFETYGPEEPGATAMLARHADRIREYMEDPDIDCEDVERWIDHVLTLADTIDQQRPRPIRELSVSSPEEPDVTDDPMPLGEFDLSDEVRDALFGDEFDAGGDEGVVDERASESDVLAFLWAHGMQYDQDRDRAVEMTGWQRDVIEMLRAEAYYFAPQRMTKVMNEGWSAYYESLMMTGEGFAEPDELVQYADHMAQVLGSPGLNPYKLGMELWAYIENTTNRREVLERLLQVKGISWRTLRNVVDFEEIRETVAPPPALARITAETLDDLAQLDDQFVDEDALCRARSGTIDVDRYPWKVLTFSGLARRNYSLVKPQYRGFLQRVSDAELERIHRYVGETDRYGSIEEALAAVDYTAGWRRMQEVRESHNDVTFLDEFLTREFLEDRQYFTFEYSYLSDGFHAASTDYEDVKRKLLLSFTNFGKPRITVADGNHENRNELLLVHHYNGIMLDLDQARDVLERTFELWGRAVNLKTVVKQVDDGELKRARREQREPEHREQGLMLRFDGDEFSTSELPWDAVEGIISREYDGTQSPNWHR